MSSETFNYIFHLLDYSFILHFQGVLTRRIYFTLFTRFFYISVDGQPSSTACMNRYFYLLDLRNINKKYIKSHQIVSMLEYLLLFHHYIEGVYITIITFQCIFVILLWHGDIEPNLGPRKLPLSAWHWNLNSLSAHNFSKFTQLKAYISIY